jgi:hypothetical protein
VRQPTTAVMSPLTCALFRNAAVLRRTTEAPSRLRLATVTATMSQQYAQMSSQFPDVTTSRAALQPAAVFYLGCVSLEQLQ